MKLAAGVLAILAYPLVVVAVLPEHLGPIYAAAALIPTFAGLALAGLYYWTQYRLRSGQPDKGGLVDRASALLVLFLALAIAATSLVFAANVVLHDSAPWVCGVAIVWALIWLPVAIRRISVTTSILVDRDPKAVFWFVSDFRNSPRYIPELESVEKLTEGDIGPGTQFRERVRIGDYVTEGVDEIVDFSPPTRFTSHTLSTRGSVGVTTFAPQQGGTLVSYTYRSEVTYAEALVGAVFRRRSLVGVLRSRREAMWVRLKQLMETPAPA